MQLTVIEKSFVALFRVTDNLCPFIIEIYVVCQDCIIVIHNFVAYTVFCSIL